MRERVRESERRERRVGRVMGVWREKEDIGEM